MTIEWFLRPSTDSVALALLEAVPAARKEIRYLAEGWEFWAYEAGDLVFRVPKSTHGIRTLFKEQALLPVLAPTLPLPVPTPMFFSEAGPNGNPFAGYRRVPGVGLGELQTLAPDFGMRLGHFIRALHSFPVQIASDLGLAVYDGVATREARAGQYETIIRRVFPLLSCEARSYTEAIFERYLTDGLNFAFEPTLVHGDLDDRNMLADPVSRQLSGVIDFGDAVVGDPAVEFTWALTGGLEAHGAENQIGELVEASGGHLAALMGRVSFYRFRWPLFDILHGLETNDNLLVEDGLRSLNSSIPAGIACP
jgi:aminoglycoside phosphotransferase (APT) family kinase protein